MLINNDEVNFSNKCNNLQSMSLIKLPMSLKIIEFLLFNSHCETYSHSDTSNDLNLTLPHSFFRYLMVAADAVK